MNRYERNILTEGFSQEKQQMLFDNRVLVVGAGGLGSVVLRYLASAGVGTIGVVEYDVVSLTNLQRQILYSEADLGCKKLEVVERELKNINSEIEYRFYNTKFSVENGAEIAKGYDIIVDCTDNFEARYAIDEISSILSVPFVYGAVQNMRGEVSTFNLNSKYGYRELYPEKAKSVAIFGVLSPMPGIIGSLQALEVIKVLTNSSDSLSGKLLIFDGESYSTTIFGI